MSAEHEKCCREEALEKLLKYELDAQYELGWWLAWARRHERQVNNWLIEALSAIATADFNTIDEIQSFSAMILKRYADTEPKKIIGPRGSDAVNDEGGHHGRRGRKIQQRGET